MDESTFERHDGFAALRAQIDRLLSALWPALRATRVDPMLALRE